MPSTDNAVHAACLNVPSCAKAVAGETVEWYPGAGEYCPECGEALTPLDLMAAPPPAADAPARVRTLPTTIPNSPPSVADIQRSLRAHSKPRFMTPLRWFWIVAGALIAGSALVYAERVSAINRTPTDVISVCPIPSAQQLIVDLVRGYAAKSATPASRFVLTNTSSCDVRFSTAAETPDAVIASDGIVAIVNPLNAISRVSEKQLREIFAGSIRDWSQLGGPRGAIVPILPDAASDEAKVLASSLFFGVAIDRGVRQSGSSADVTRAVTGADRASRGAIGLVAFSQAVPAKVIPLAYLPPPSVLSIATRHYPYLLTIAVESASGHSAPAATGLIDYARSSDGAAIVVKNGLVPHFGS